MSFFLVEQNGIATRWTVHVDKSTVRRYHWFLFTPESESPPCRHDRYVGLIPVGEMGILALFTNRCWSSSDNNTEAYENLGSKTGR